MSLPNVINLGSIVFPVFFKWIFAVTFKVLHKNVPVIGLFESTYFLGS